MFRIGANKPIPFRLTFNRKGNDHLFRPIGGLFEKARHGINAQMRSHHQNPASFLDMGFRDIIIEDLLFKSYHMGAQLTAFFA